MSFVYRVGGSFASERQLSLEEQATVRSKLAGVSAGTLLRHVWLFDSQLDSELQGPEPGITALPGNGYIVNSFNGRRLLYAQDDRICLAKEVHFISFDSNVNNDLSQFFLCPKPTPSYPLIWSVLHRMRAWRRFDVQAYFNVLEHLAKATIPLPYVERTVENVLRLHALNLEVTIGSERPFYDPEILNRQQSLFGTGNFSTMAQTAAHDLAVPSSTQGAVDAIYAALIKMVLIRRSSSAKSYEQRVEQFDDFLERTLRLESLRLNVIARYYFIGLLSRLVRVEDGTPRARAIQRLRSAAWDVYFASSPERILSFRDTPVGLLAILVTRDAALASIAARFVVTSVAVFQDKGIRTSLTWNDRDLIPRLGNQRIQDDLARLTPRLSKPYGSRISATIDFAAMENLL